MPEAVAIHIEEPRQERSQKRGRRQGQLQGRRITIQLPNAPLAAPLCVNIRQNGEECNCSINMAAKEVEKIESKPVEKKKAPQNSKLKDSLILASKILLLLLTTGLLIGGIVASFTAGCASSATPLSWVFFGLCVLQAIAIKNVFASAYQNKFFSLRDHEWKDLTAFFKDFGCKMVSFIDKASEKAVEGLAGGG